MEEGFARHIPGIVFAAIMLLLLWHFFIRRALFTVLHKFGYLRFTSFDDEKRGINDHIRFLRSNFRRSQKIKRKCYYRIITDENRNIKTGVLNGRTTFFLQCLETGEVREMPSSWVEEALYFRIISNADNINGAVTLVEDVYTKPVPEFNKKVGDISYFNRVIGAYSDWSLIQMDVDAVTSDFYKG